MKLLSKSKRNFLFDPEGEYTDKTTEKVNLMDGVLYFKLIHFSSEEECRKWWDENKNEFEKVIGIDKKQVKELNVKIESGEVTDDEWGKIQSLMTRPGEFSREDIAVYHPIIAHNIIDRDRERFTKSVLQGFQKTAVDKSVLLGHNHSVPGEGVVFDAKLVKIDDPEREFGPLPAKVKKLLPDILETDGAFYGLKTPFYMLKDDVQFTRKIDAGIVRHMSIGFGADQREPVKDTDGNVKYWQFTGDGNMMEVSFVWLGSQYGARNRKSADSDDSDNSAQAGDEPKNPDNSAQADPTPNAAQTDDSKSEAEMELKFESLDLEIKSDDAEEVTLAIEEKVTEILDREKQANDKVEELETKSKELQTEVDRLNGILGDLTEDDLKAIKSAAEARKTELVEEAIKYGSLVGLIEKDQVEEKRKAFTEMSDEALKERVEEYKKIYDKAHPAESQLDDTEDEEPVEKSSVPKIRFEMF